MFYISVKFDIESERFFIQQFTLFIPCRALTAFLVKQPSQACNSICRNCSSYYIWELGGGGGGYKGELGSIFGF